MEFDHILYHPGQVTRIILNRPRFLNAQGSQLLDEMDQAFEAAASDRDCGAIVISGAGRSFSVGHDLGTAEEIEYCERNDLAKPYDSDLHKKVSDMHEYFVKKTLAWRNCPKPTIAMVHGYCIYAGWMIAAAMDIIFADEEALFLPGMVEYFSVPWDMGTRKTKEILFEHRFITAAEAMASGFVNRTYPSDQLEQETMAYASRVADNYRAAPSWLETIKSSVNHMEEAMGFSSEIESAYNSFCLMYGLGAHTTASPDSGGFARTDLARQNFLLARPWLLSRGLCKPESTDG